MAPAYQIPYRAYALFIAVVLLIILVVFVLKWIGEKKPAPKNRLLLRRIFAITMGFAVGSTSFFLATYQYPASGVCGSCGFELILKVANSSGNLDINDFSITGNDLLLGGQLDVQRGFQSLSTGKMPYGDMFSVRLYCNGTSVFWGASNITAQVHTSYVYVLLLYPNSTRDFIAVTLTTAYWGDDTAIIHFGYGTEWVNLRVELIEWVE